MINCFVLQCRLGEGVCPDTQHSSGQCTNDIIPGSVQGSSQDGIQCIAFAKYFTTSIHIISID